MEEETSIEIERNRRTGTCILAAKTRCARPESVTCSLPSILGALDLLYRPALLPMLRPVLALMVSAAVVHVAASAAPELCSCAADAAGSLLSRHPWSAVHRKHDIRNLEGSYAQNG